MTLLKQVPWLLAAFVFCFVACGCIFWRGSYQEYLAATHWETVPLFAGVALVLTWFVGARVILSTFVIGIAFPTTIFVRVVRDCMADPTNHNLWPIEIVLAFLFATLIAFPAAGIGWVLRRFTHRRHQAGVGPD